MKKLIILASTFATLSAFGGEWMNLTHSLNEVTNLNCRLEEKKVRAKHWSTIASVSDKHSGLDNRKFKYQLMLNDGYITNRYLTMEFILNSWDYEVENFETGEWESFRRTGKTNIIFKIEDKTLIDTNTIRSMNISTNDIADTELKVQNPSDRTSYRFICDKR